MSEWTQSVGLWKNTKVVQRLWKKSAKVTRHFAIRLFQRFDQTQRREIIRELHFMLSSGMYPSLFAPGEQHALVTLNNRYALAVTMKDDKLVLKTIYEPGVF